MKKETKKKRGNLDEIEDLRMRLEEAEEALRAIRSGEVDALVVTSPKGEEIFTLKGADQPYRVFVEAMTEGAATLDPGGTILYCNNSFSDMVRTPPDKVIGSSIYQFIPPADTSHFQSAFETGKRKETKADISFKGEDEGSTPVHLSFNALDGQDLPVVCMVATDLTEHKRYEEEILKSYAELEMKVQERTAELTKINEILRSEIAERRLAEEALRESEARLRLAIQSTRAMVYDLDVSSQRVNAFSGLEGLLGYEAGESEPTLQWWDQQIHPDDLDICHAAFRRMRATLHDHALEYRVRHRDGRMLCVEDHATPVCDAAGQLVRIVGTVVDITERKRMENELRKSRDELGKRVQERTSELSEAVERLRVENIHRKQLEDTLRESEIQVRFFASQCLTAQETERKRVAGELHDSIAAALGAMRFRIDKVVEEMKQGNGSFESLQDLGSKVVEINNEVRRIMADLRPSILDDLGIVAAMDWFCREYQKTYSYISVEKQIGIQEHEVPDSLKTPMFRISQEAMNNIAKHGQASHVNLSLRKENNGILLTIQDNGQGFDISSVKKGMGLSTMKERAQLSGGTFGLESAVGKGTLIRASWPI